MNIKATSKDGVIRRILFNENILLIDREDSLTFNIIDKELNLNFNFTINFSDDGKELSTSGNVSEDKTEIIMTLHKWQNTQGSEITKPIEFKIQEKRIWIKFKTAAHLKNNFRNFHLTIWGEV